MYIYLFNVIGKTIHEATHDTYKILVLHVRSWKSPLCPNNKYKAEQTEKLTTLLGYVRVSRIQGKLLPPRLER